MKLIYGSLPELTTASQGVAATIGNFDGVHRGHQALIASLQQQASLQCLPSAVILFEPQPKEFFAQSKAPARLYPLRDKLVQLASLAVDYVICLKFDKKLAAMPPEHFANQLLFNSLAVRHLLVGHDFRFGYQRRGDMALLSQLAKSHSVTVREFNDVLFDAERISSTRVRQAIVDGDFDLATAMLGRPYALYGRVIHGAKRGRQWGIPTANLRFIPSQLVLSGVYDVIVKRSNQVILPGVANVGTRPTVDGLKAVCEVHLHDFDEPLYGEWLQVTFLHKRRSEMKFSSIEQLIAQIKQDILASKSFFKHQQHLTG